MATQRAAVLNKDVLTQIEVLVCLRTPAPQDRDAIDAWIKVHGTPEQRAQMMQSLASLPIGTAWFWSPGWLDVFKQVQVRRRHTFDSSATPKPGQPKTPKKLAAVDLSKLTTEMAATIERAKADDPKELRKRIAELEKQVAAKPHGLSTVDRQKLLDQAIAERDDTWRKFIARAVDEFRLPYKVRAGIDQRQRPAPIERVAPKPLVKTPVNRTPSDGLAGGERKILTVLAQYRQGRSKVQIALLAGYSHKGGGFNNYLGALRSRGLIEGSIDRTVITEAGRDALGDYQPLPTGVALQEYWLGQLGKAERSCLEALIGSYPSALAKEEVAAAAGYEAKGGGFNNALGKLRTLELIEGRGELRANRVLIE